jgi:hypothetical protein
MIEKWLSASSIAKLLGKNKRVIHVPQVLDYNRAREKLEQADHVWVRQRGRDEMPRPCCCAVPSSPSPVGRKGSGGVGWFHPICSL